MRVLLADGKSAFVFEFTAETSKARAQRDSIVEAQKQAAAPASVAPATAGAQAAVNSRPMTAAPAAEHRSDPLAGHDLRALKQSLLASRPQLRLEYQELVASRVVSDGEFWSTDARRSLLVDAALAHPQVGLSSRAPHTLLRTTAPAGSDPNAPASAPVKVTQQMKLAIFKREPAVQEAFLAFVPDRMSERDFWKAYLTADRERAVRRQQLEDGQLLLGPGSSSGGAASSASSGPGRPLSDIKGMVPHEFFDALRKGEFPAAGSRRGPPGVRHRSSMGHVDATFDLLSTVEDSARASSLRGLPSSAGGPAVGADAASGLGGGRGGYGTGESARAYDAAGEVEMLLGSGGAGSRQASLLDQRMEGVRKRERAAGAVIEDVNSYSKQVVESSASAPGPGAASSAPIAPPSSPTNRGKGAASSSSTGNRYHSAPPSSANDLPDLYQSVPLERSLVRLNVDLDSLRDALAAQGADEDDEDDTVAGAGGTAARGGGAADSGSSSAAVVRHVSSSSWSVVDGPAGSGSASSSQAQATVVVVAQDVQPAARKRARIEERALTAAVAAAIDDSGPPPPMPDAFEALAGRPFLAASKRLLRELTSSAHDLFEAADRSSRTGMLRTVPKAWQAYVERRFRLNCEICNTLWPVLTTQRKDPRAADRRRRLLESLTAEYANLERLKREVMAKGAHALAPPSDSSGRATELEVAVVPSSETDGASGTSDLVALLNMLQGALHPTIDKAEEVAQQPLQ